MNNWLYAVMTIFAQRFNTCSPRFGGKMKASLPSPGYAPGSSNWWPCGFDPFFAISKPQTAHAGNEQTKLTWLAKSATDSKMRRLVVVR